MGHTSLGIFFISWHPMYYSVLALFGVVGASSLWGIGELLDQKKRVEKGWFPMNPKRKNEYHLKNIRKNEQIQQKEK